MSNEQLQPAAFTFDGGDHVFRGYHEPSAAEVLPYLTRSEFERMADEVYNDPSNGLVGYNASADAFVFTCDGVASIHRATVRVVASGAEMKLYPAGGDDEHGGGWGWVVTTPPAGTEVPAPRLAREFARVLRAYLTPDQMALAVERNDAEPGGRYRNEVCHSHDFCDANMAMLEAFAKLARISEDDVDLQEHVETFNAAWGYAKAAGFEPDAIPVDLLERLQATYPALDFGLVDKQSVNEEAPEVPHLLIAFEHGGVCMTAPHASECSRFTVDPLKAYGIAHADAEAIKAHNRVLC